MRRLVRLHAGPQTWRQALDAFLLYKQAEGRSARTLHDYAKHVERFFARYPDCWPDAQRLKAAVLDYLSQPVSPSTYNLRLTYLKAFFAWCHAEGLIEHNPCASFRRRKAEGRARLIEPGDLRRLLEQPDTRTFSGLRDYALMLLTLDTGIRPSEALALRPCDVNLRSREVVVPAQVAKTRVSRTLPISPVTAQALAKLLGARHPAWRADVPVFCSQDGTPLSPLAWSHRVRQYARRAGIVLRAYDLRHAFATTFLRQGGNPLALQRLLGHADLAMTRRYVHLTQQDLKEQHAQASPVMALLPQRARRRRL